MIRNCVNSSVQTTKTNNKIKIELTQWSPRLKTEITNLRGCDEENKVLW